MLGQLHAVQLSEKHSIFSMNTENSLFEGIEVNGRKG